MDSMTSIFRSARSAVSRESSDRRSVVNSRVSEFVMLVRERVLCCSFVVERR